MPTYLVTVKDRADLGVIKFKLSATRDENLDLPDLIPTTKEISVTAAELTTATATYQLAERPARSFTFFSNGLNTATPKINILKTLFSITPGCESQSRITDFLSFEEWLDNYQCRGCGLHILRNKAGQSKDEAAKAMYDAWKLWSLHRVLCTEIDRKIVLAVLREFEDIKTVSDLEGDGLAIGYTELQDVAPGSQPRSQRESMKGIIKGSFSRKGSLSRKQSLKKVFKKSN